MAKKKQAEKKEVKRQEEQREEAPERKEEDEKEEQDGEEELELLQVDVGDMVKVKQVLDETVAGALLETLEENYRLDNFKLILMSVSCLFAVVAQFAPIPFPDSRPVLGICCCAYFILSGILQFITSYIDQDAILVTTPVTASTNKNLQQYGVRVRSSFPRFSEWYTVILEFQGMENSPMVEQKWSVGKFFDVEGMFDEVGVKQEIEALYTRLEKGQYDAKKSDDKKSLEAKKNQ
jgi:signal peptidase complex subunit 2